MFEHLLFNEHIIGISMKHVTDFVTYRTDHIYEFKSS